MWHMTCFEAFTMKRVRRVGKYYCKDAFVACSRCSNREVEQRDAIRKNSKGVG